MSNTYRPLTVALWLQLALPIVVISAANGARLGVISLIYVVLGLIYFAMAAGALRPWTWARWVALFLTVAFGLSAAWLVWESFNSGYDFLTGRLPAPSSIPQNVALSPEGEVIVYEPPPGFVPPTPTNPVDRSPYVALLFAAGAALICYAHVRACWRRRNG